MAWLLVVYVGSLVLMVVVGVLQARPVSQEPTTELTTENLRTRSRPDEFVEVVLKSVGVAAAVTVLCFVLALPMAFYIAKVAKPWARRALIVAVLLPLWAGYLVKGYAWKAMLRPASEFGVDSERRLPRLGVRLDPRLRLDGGDPVAHVHVVAVHGAADLRRARSPPASLLDASGDLGARPLRTFRSVVMPMLVPSIAAGSIFTFSLSLGDFIIPNIVTEGKVRLVGKLIESTLQAPNQPLAAAFTLWPLLIIIVYLSP